MIRTVYSKLRTDQVIRGVDLIVYRKNRGDGIFYPIKESCVLLGYSPDWFYRSRLRPAVYTKLLAFGVSKTLKKIPVLLGRVYKDVDAFTQSDLIAIAKASAARGNQKGTDFLAKIEQQKTAQSDIKAAV